MPYIQTLLSKLIRIRTVNYAPEDYPGKSPDRMQSPGQEYKVAKIVENEFSEAGIKYKVFNRGKRPDIIAFIGQNKPGYRKLLLAAHMDTVPGGEGWTVTKPFVPKMVGCRMYGRGATDDKGPLAALVSAAKALKKQEKTINGCVIVAAVSDEEVNLCPGLESLIKKKAICPTDAIMPDVGGSMHIITVGEKASLNVSVKAFGKAAHGSTPQLGKNAICGMSEFLSLLQAYQLRHVHDPLFPDGPTINVGMIKGGDAPNKVAAECEAVLNIRYLPSQNRDDIIAELRQISSQVSIKGVKFAFSVRSRSDAFKLSPSAPIVKAVMRFSGAKLKGIGGGTVSKLLVRQGIDSVGFAPGDEDVAHMADEYIDIAELEKFSVIVQKIARDIANTKTF
jgi:acetylornithine deacetylase/succinyl-diaminopimelate desuccinylase-like protein